MQALQDTQSFMASSIGVEASAPSPSWPEIASLITLARPLGLSRSSRVTAWDGQEKLCSAERQWPRPEHRLA